MTVHEKRLARRVAGRFRSNRIFRERRLRITVFEHRAIANDEAAAPAGRRVIERFDDRVEIRDVQFDFGPWVPAEDGEAQRLAFFRARGWIP